MSAFERISKYVSNIKILPSSKHSLINNHEGRHYCRVFGTQVRVFGTPLVLSKDL